MKWSSLNQSVEAKVWVVLSGAKCGYEGLSLQPRVMRWWPWAGTVCVAGTMTALSCTVWVEPCWHPNQQIMWEGGNIEQSLASTKARRAKEP